MDIDLHPDTVSNIEMGYIFEELIRKFNESSNETAGDHFTHVYTPPRPLSEIEADLEASEKRILELLGRFVRSRGANCP